MLQEITLQQDHKEGDVQHYKGQTVMLPKETVEWLKSVGLAQRAEAVIVVEAQEVEVEQPVKKSRFEE